MRFLLRLCINFGDGSRCAFGDGPVEGAIHSNAFVLQVALSVRKLATCTVASSFSLAWRSRQVKRGSSSTCSSLSVQPEGTESVEYITTIDGGEAIVGVRYLQETIHHGRTE